jgi:ribose-phosphate pyrophosphokinase
VGGRLIADLLSIVRFERIVAVDLHTASLEGFFSFPLEHLSAVRLLTNEIKEMIGTESVIVAPDLGAVKLAESYGELLRRPIAIVHKTRLSGEAVRVRGIAGQISGRAPVIVDDMISTGATIEAAGAALIAAGSLPEITVVATHALLVGPAVTRLSLLPLKRIVVSDSLPVSQHRGSLPLQIVSLAPMLSETVTRLNLGEAMTDLLNHR